MYLKELLEEAVLKKEPDEEQDIVLLPAEILPWCDMPLVIDRSTWGDIYVKYRAKEPDIEMIATLFSASPSKVFLKEFANEEVVRTCYQRLRTELSNTKQEDPGMQNETQHGDFQNDSIGDEFGVPTLGAELAVAFAEVVGVAAESEAQTAPVGINPEMVEGLQPSVGVDSDGIDPSIFQTMGTGEDEFSVPLSPSSSVSADDVENPETSTIAETEYVEPVSLSGEEQCASDEGMEECASDEVSPDLEEFVPDTQAGEENKRPQVLQGYLREVDAAKRILTDVEDWAAPVTRVFANMHRDFTTLFDSVSVKTVLEGNNTTAEKFMESWAELNWDDNAEADLCNIESPEAFLALLVHSYADCLKYCCYGQEDKAYSMAQLFADLIYEE